MGILDWFCISVNASRFPPFITLMAIVAGVPSILKQVQDFLLIIQGRYILSVAFSASEIIKWFLFLMLLCDIFNDLHMSNHPSISERNCVWSGPMAFSGIIEFSWLLLHSGMWHHCSSCIFVHRFLPLDLYLVWELKLCWSCRKSWEESPFLWVACVV